MSYLIILYILSLLSITKKSVSSFNLLPFCFILKKKNLSLSVSSKLYYAFQNNKNAKKSIKILNIIFIDSIIFKLLHQILPLFWLNCLSLHNSQHLNFMFILRKKKSLVSFVSLYPVDSHLFSLLGTCLHRF